MPAQHPSTPLPHTIDCKRWNVASDLRFMHVAGPKSWFGLHFNTGHPHNCFGQYMPDNFVERVRPYDVVVMLVGAWDAAWSQNISSFEVGLERGVQTFRHAWPGVQIVLVTVGPIAGGTSSELTGVVPERVQSVDQEIPAWRIEDAVVEVNRRIRAVARRRHVTVVDAHAMVMARPDKHRLELWEPASKADPRSYRWPLAAWHFSEFAAGQKGSGATIEVARRMGNLSGEISRHIATRVLNLICPAT